MPLMISLMAHTSASSAKVGVFTSEVCIGHDPGWFNPESPKRLETLITALRTEWVDEFGDRLQVFEPEVDVSEEQLRRVHTDAHLRTLASAFDRAGGLLTPRVNLDGDTIVSSGSQAAAARAAGLVTAAVDEIFCTTSSLQRAFVMVRPPGHHAEPNQPCGFCLYNNVMVGVAHAQDAHGARNVAILDFDVHQGNGCAAACWSAPTRLYVSSHQRGIFPIGVSSFSPESAGRAGEYGNVLSYPLNAGAGSTEFRQAWTELLPLVSAFEPELIFLNCGFDAHAEEMVASLALADDDFGWLTAEIAKLGLPVVSVLEGGYNLDVLKRGAKAHVGALIDA